MKNKKPNRDEIILIIIQTEYNKLIFLIGLYPHPLLLNIRYIKQANKKMVNKEIILPPIIIARIEDVEKKPNPLKRINEVSILLLFLDNKLCIYNIMNLYETRQLLFYLVKKNI